MPESRWMDETAADQRTSGLAWVVRDAVRAEVSGSGEKLLWESDGSRERKGRPLPGDLHGFARWQLFSLQSTAVLILLVALLLLLNVEFYGGHWVIAALAVSLIGFVLSRRVRGSAVEDSRDRYYVLYDRRLVVVGADSFAQFDLSDMQWVETKPHKDGTGTMVCACDGGQPGGTVAIEGVEDYGEVLGLIRAHAPALLRYRWQSLLPNKYARKLRQG